MIYPDGKEKIYSIIVDPQFLAETYVIDGGPNICSAITLAKTQTIFYSKEKAQIFLESNPTFAFIIMHTLAKKIRYMQNQVEDGAFRLPQKLARLLLFFYTETESPLKQDKKMLHNKKLIVTHDELAHCLGSTRPKITKYINEFYQQGMIEKGRGFVRIKDDESLIRMCGKYKKSIVSESRGRMILSLFLVESAMKLIVPKCTSFFFCFRYII
jgi:CRP-like cAMP-binding protein